MIHELKLDTKYFQDVFAYKKRFEIRKNDRGYKVGDTLRLIEYLPDLKCTTTSRMDVEVLYILDDATYLPAGYICMSIGKPKYFEIRLRDGE